ncbi:MAG TPA: glutamate synthase large subunit [Gemmatimonadaceae bacterium]
MPRDFRGLPPAQGLYDPAFEHDGCGIGFVAHLRGVRSREIVDSALELLTNLAHRSAIGGDSQTGDGAGILFHIPHAHFRLACRPLDFRLPDAGEYGVGMVFLPTLAEARHAAEQAIERCVTHRGCRVLGWRDVPTNDALLGGEAARTRPSIRQFFVAPPALHRDADDAPAFERTLYVLRRAIERALDDLPGEERSYVASLSSRTIVYKGLLRPEQLAGFYPDLTAPETMSGLALVHSRFATNTFPTWSRAHPYRMLCHNGEINTLRGNVNWMRVREERMAAGPFGDAMGELLPIIQPEQSDSATLDNVLEFLVHAGRPLPHAMAMLVPKAWEHDPDLEAERRAFYEYHASQMEPWDGPAAIAFTDGRVIGALQDRNGLRPARWTVTDDDWVVLASEAGALPVSNERIRAQGRLQPGCMLVVNTLLGKVLTDDDVQNELASHRPYSRWIANHRVPLELPENEPGEAEPLADHADAIRANLARFGFSREELSMVLAPMAASGDEPVGSMGNDAPSAILSDRSQLLYSYFRQLFAQVTNPAIDPIRERIVMSLGTFLGPLHDLLDESPEHARQIRLDHPVLDARGMTAIRALAEPSLRACTLTASFPDGAGDDALASSVEALCRQAVEAVDAGFGIIILSDRVHDETSLPMPSLLAVAAVHHHLIREGRRSRVSIVCESGDAREVSHVAVLFSYGAAAVHPYLALNACALLADDDSIATSPATARANLIKAFEKGLLKVLSKLGISTLQSYCGAQAWEALGLSKSLVAQHFTGTSSRLGGVGLAEIAQDVRRRARSTTGDALLEDGGEYHYRIQGERHAWNPQTIATLQRAARDGDASSYRAFSDAANDFQLGDRSLRALLDVKVREPIPLETVEPAAAIVRRFATGAMSFGSLSREAHEMLAETMNEIGGRSNTGEGGEDPARFGTRRNSAIKQVASARFGVTALYLVNARELQIKIAQGAKPGEGGQLPGHKVDDEIARIRHSTPGVSLISPPPHHDIYSIEDLKQLIFDLRSVHPEATISVKLVSEAGVGTVAAGVAKAGADLIVISGDSGGTGASPLSSIKRAGIPWEIGLSEAHQTLILNDLRGQVRLQTDGQLKTGRDVVIAALLGAEEFAFATAPLVVAGCVMMRKCHLNTCPVGIATQDPVLREKFAGKPEHLVNYFFFVAEEVREILAKLGARTLDEVVGRVDLLESRTSVVGGRAAMLDLSALLHQPDAARDWRDVRAERVSPQRDAEAQALMDLAAPALERGESVRATLPIRNSQRAVGAEISGEIARRYGGEGLPTDTIVLRFRGAAGQSFGAFAAHGLSLELEGVANDYVAKGLSGGRVAIRPPKGARLLADGTVIVGNTALYGATAGEVFIAGAAGERFAVRNSGARIVVEGVGDHACEYMTGGIVVVLGGVGRNFGAGMSGGLAFVADERGTFRARSHTDTLEIEAVQTTEDERTLHGLLEWHMRYTGSRRAKRALGRWSESVRSFVRVMPVEYREALEREARRLAASEGARYG